MRLQRQRGFSLLEVLVAFAILALSLGVMLQIFSRAATTAQTATRYSQAAALAESVLAAVGTTIPLEVGEQAGDGGNGLQWTLAIAEASHTGSGFTEPPARPLLLNVRVLWEDRGKARRLDLATLRLAAPL